MAPKVARRKKEGGGSNVFSMFEQSQIQEFKEAFTIMDQNRDGFIDKADLRDTFAALGEKAKMRCVPTLSYKKLFNTSPPPVSVKGEGRINIHQHAKVCGGPFS
ncbi:Myosin regulatory light chain 2, ventricular/cardiac muscle isoform [Varanus komodoensis]|nr:Myosin regulatory light chain 2, ventricular/cardiac muscle isoform [Varanus komodoensis]